MNTLLQTQLDVYLLGDTIASIDMSLPFCVQLHMKGDLFEKFLKIRILGVKVIWTDVFQLFFMFLSTGYIIVVATQQAGGPAKVAKII